MRRLLIPLTLGAVLLATGCGDERPGPAAEPGSTLSAAPTAGPTLSATPSPTAAPTAPALTGPLAGFPLALGYDSTNGDDHSPVEVTEQPATKAFGECGSPVWDPGKGTTDVIGVSFRGEAEWARGRTMVLFPTVDGASGAVRTASTAITNCPRDDGDDYGWTEHTGINYDAGDQSFGWIDRYWSADVDGFDTGLTVYHVVRVGRAVLFTYEYDEGNGSDETREQSVSEAADADRPVVDEMRSLPVEEAFTLTPQGGAPFRLGMSIEQARLAAADVVVDEQPRLCPQLSWTDPSGVHVHGAFSPGIGLAYLSTDGGTTVEGVAFGGTLAALRAAYPNLVHTDNGLWSSDQGATSYAFELGPDHTIDWMLLTDKDQRCVS